LLFHILLSSRLSYWEMQKCNVCCAALVLWWVAKLCNGAVGRHLFTVPYLSCSGSQKMDYLIVL
jgi:hypothetical protein